MDAGWMYLGHESIVHPRFKRTRNDGKVIIRAELSWPFSSSCSSSRSCASCQLAVRDYLQTVNEPSHQCRRRCEQKGDFDAPSQLLSSSAFLLRWATSSSFFLASRPSFAKFILIALWSCTMSKIFGIQIHWTHTFFASLLHQSTIAWTEPSVWPWRMDLGLEVSDRCLQL